MRQNEGESLGAAHSGAELCWGRVWGYRRRGGGTEWPGALRVYSQTTQVFPSPRKGDGEIRLQQDLVLIKVTRPQIVARQCLREVSQKEEGVPCDEGNSLLSHPAWVPGSAPWTATLLLPCLFFRHSLFLLWSLGIATCPSRHPGLDLEGGGSGTRGWKPSCRGPYPPPHPPSTHTPPLFP